jgi:membrane dipeptidase
MKNLSTAIKFLPIIVLAFLFGCGNETNSKSQGEISSESELKLIERAKIIHDQTITLDTHADINSQNFTLDVNYTMNLDTQVNLVKMEAGKLDAAWFIVYTAQGNLDEEGYQAAYANAIDKFEAIHLLADEIAPDEIELAYTSADVRRIARTGKKVAMIGIENAYPIALDLANIKDFHDRGGRYMSLAHNGHSQFADSHTGDADGVYLHNGLSDLGRQAIKEMNRWGIIVDISHPSKESIIQMLDLTQAPVIASHSSARQLTNHTRNLDNETLLRIKENGGVVQTVAFGSYVNEERRLYLERAADDDNLNRDEAPKATVSDFVDHIDFLVELIGTDHVGIASDFDGGGGIEGWNDASETFNVTLELVRRGYSEEHIQAIWSGNLLRVLDEVQRISEEIQQI